MALALTMAPATAIAQENVEGSVSVDFVSRYMWRGLDMGGITLKPGAKVAWQDASFEIKGITGLDNDEAREINLTLGYQLGPVNIGVIDHWCTGMHQDGHETYFDWDPVKSGHRLEANLGLTLPFCSLQAYTMFYGNDFKYNTLQDTEDRVNGKRAYSTYVEPNVPFYMGGLDWDVTAGITPFESAYKIKPVYSVSGFSIVEKDYFYAGSFSCVMASVRATKRLEIGDVKVPLFAELHTNPYLKQANFLVGLRVEPFK